MALQPVVKSNFIHTHTHTHTDTQSYTFIHLYTHTKNMQRSRPSPRKRNARSQNGCLRRPYKYPRKEEKLKAKEKRKDIPI